MTSTRTRLINRAWWFLIAVLLALGVLCLVGCAESRTSIERRQATADSAATIYEAATAIEQGATPAAPLNAIKSNASAIATAQGHPYPPAPVPPTVVP